MSTHFRDESNSTRDCNPTCVSLPDLARFRVRVRVRVRVEVRARARARGRLGLGLRLG